MIIGGFRCLTRSAVFCRNEYLESAFTNGLGRVSEVKGRRRRPLPPAKMIGVMLGIEGLVIGVTEPFVRVF